VECSEEHLPALAGDSVVLLRARGRLIAGLCQTSMSYEVLDGSIILKIHYNLTLSEID
jgi:hypothetical protein